MQFKTKKQITVPVLKLENGQTRYFKCASNIYEGKAIDDKKAPAVVNAFDLQTGEAGMIILPTIAVNELMQGYPQGVAGLCFALTKRSLEGKKYNAVDLSEIEDPTAGADTPEEAEKAAKSLRTRK
jgi:hypothetical protein